MRACAEASSIPIGADEEFHSTADIKRHNEMGADKGGSLKPIKLGSLFEVMEAVQLLVDLDMHVNLAEEMADTSIASTTMSHLGVIVPQVDGMLLYRRLT